MKVLLRVVLFFICTIGYSQNWQTNFSTAKTKALASNKNILLVFTGSDWCAPCIKLDKSVWQSDVFKTYSEKLILVKADFPKKKQNQLTEEMTKQNQDLASIYNPEGVFPLVVVLDKSGKVLGKESYKNISPNDYILLIDSFIK